jgi:hypothetical protein
MKNLISRSSVYKSVNKSGITLGESVGVTVGISLSEKIRFRSIFDQILVRHFAVYHPSFFNHSPVNSSARTSFF